MSIGFLSSRPSYTPPPPSLSSAAERAAARPAAGAAVTSPGPGRANQPLPENPALRKSAHEFETMFVSQMLSHMWENMEVDETFGGGHGEEMFRGMLVNEYGKQITQRGGIGIADSAYRAMLEAQEKSP